MLLTLLIDNFFLQNQERRQGSKSLRETVEELAEATKIFEEF